MRVDFIIKRETRTRLILVYAGWGSGTEIASGINIPGWDVAVVHDYSDFNLDTSFLNEYYTVYLFAWSLGVYAAAKTLPADRITSAFAINGTLSPVDDTKGIPTDIFRGTAANLTVPNLQKFQLRMMPNREAFMKWKEEHSNLFTSEAISNLRIQLEQFIYSTERKDKLSELPWIKAYIGKSDRIFPAQNMISSWQGISDVSIIESNDAHWMNISDIVSNNIADVDKVSKKFNKAKSSYNSNAIAQYMVAARLHEQLKRFTTDSDGSILEIGCGTGLFTRMYGNTLRPKDATFVDIVDLEPFNIADKESYVKADAEAWIASDEIKDRRWDYILSSSAIQWFADIPSFLRQCSAHLNKGGILAISTYLPGNMGELDELRPSPLNYPSLKMLSEQMNLLFSDVILIEDEIKIEFKSVREMLMHLKQTGVSGTSGKPGLTLSKMKDIRSLTYRPVYILGRKG